MKNIYTTLIVGLICGVSLGVVPTTFAQQMERQLGFACNTPTPSSKPGPANAARIMSAPAGIVGDSQFAVCVGRTGNGEDDVVYLRIKNDSVNRCFIVQATVKGPTVAGLHIYQQDQGVSFGVQKPVICWKAKWPQVVVPTVSALKPVAKNGIDPGESLTLIVIPTGDTWARELWEDLLYGDDVITIDVETPTGKKNKTTTTTFTSMSEIEPS